MYPPRRRRSSVAPLRLLPVEDGEKEKPLSSVIVSLRAGSTYDDLYGTVAQEAPDGKVHVYLGAMPSLERFIALLKKRDEKVEGSKDEACQQAKEAKSTPSECAFSQFMDDIEVEGVDVVFNFECCSEFSSSGFGSHGPNVKEMLRILVERGWLTIFSDFSLKALLADWDTTILGPKAFAKLGEFSNGFTLRFKPETLSQCVSSQLQAVGDLCKDGHAVIHAMGGTIIYNPTPEAYSNDTYTLEILTIQTEWSSSFAFPSTHTKCKLGEHEGAAGHCILSYASGAQIITSSGHWVELSKLDVSTKTLMQHASARYGTEYCRKMESEVSAARTDRDRDAVRQRYAKAFVSQCAPSRKGRYM